MMKNQGKEMKKERKRRGKKCMAGFELGAVGLYLKHIDSTVSSVLVVGKLPRSSIYSMRGQGCNNRGGIPGIIAWQWTNQIPSVVLQGIICRLAQVHCIYHNGL